MKCSSIISNEVLQLISYQLKMEKSLGSPVIYNIETTNHCYMDCIMCPRSYMKREVQHMELYLFKRIIDLSKDYTEFVWLDHFGDPLLNPNIFDMIAYAKSKKLCVGLSTNATSLNPKKSQKLIDVKLDLLHISLDGIDQETYQYYRGENAKYEIAVENIQEHIRQKLELHNSFPYTVVAMVKMEKTIPQIETFKKLWSRDGIDRVFIKTFSAMSGTLDSINKLRIKSNLKKSLKPSPRCYFPWSRVTILANGKVVPCCYDYDGKVILGDITKDSLVSIWNGDEMKRLRREHILGDYSENELCKNCHDRMASKGFIFILRRIKNIIKIRSNRGCKIFDIKIWYS